MTQEEALAQALLKVLGYGEVSAQEEGSTGIERVAPLVIAALPEGWALMHLANGPEVWEAEGMARGIQQERKRLLKLCGLGMACSCPISQDLRLRE